MPLAFHFALMGLATFCAFYVPGGHLLSAFMFAGGLLAIGPMAIPVLVFASVPIVEMSKYYTFMQPVSTMAVVFVLSLASTLHYLRKRPRHWIQLAGMVMVINTPFLLYIGLNGNFEYPEIINRYIMLMGAVLGWSMPIFVFSRYRIDADDLALSVLYGTLACFLYLLVLQHPWFSRLTWIPVLDVGRSSGLCAALAVYCLFFSGLKSHALKAMLVVALWVALLCGVGVLTRQGFIAFLAFLGVLVLMRRTGTTSRMTRLLVFAALGLGVLITANLSELLQSRNTDLFSFETRLDAYRWAYELFEANPLMGSGLGGFGIMVGVPAQYPHNFILELLAETGLIGLATLSLTLFALMSQLNTDRFLQKGHASPLMLPLLAFWFSVSAVSYSLPHSYALMPLLAVVIAEYLRGKSAHHPGELKRSKAPARRNRTRPGAA